MEKIKQFLINKEDKKTQIFKYVVSGGFATCIDMIIFFLVAWLVFPALTEHDFVVRFFNLHVPVIQEHSRAINFCIANLIAFVFSNFTAYILNVFFVFEAGKHNRKKEVFLFYSISTLVSLGSVGLGMFLIKFLYLSTTISYMSKVLTSVIVNYTARKTFVFH